MNRPENNVPDNEGSLQNLIKKREELDREVTSRYSRDLTLMFTDIQGSTEFYDQHGDINGRILIEKHDQVVNPALKEFGGNVIKSTGDGMLITFHEPADGVRAAITVQKRLQELNAGKSIQEQIKVRIALNYGNVLQDSGDVHGLEVSVAARISALTKADQIVISQSVYERVKKQKDIVCEPLARVKVKGVKRPLQLYAVDWGGGEASLKSVKDSSDQSDVMRKKRKVFVLEITKETGKIKISGYEKQTGEHKTVSYYEEIEIDDDKINQYNRDVIDLLNRANKTGLVSRDIIGKLKTAGQLLYDRVFSLKLKQKMSETTARSMILNIDDNLVNIPWELLHDGDSFLCIKFNIGRVVRTRQSISSSASRKIGSPIKMLILSDPQGNLKSAYQEGFSIRDNLEKMDDTVRVDIKSSSIHSKYFMGEIRNYDVVHYAGHADYDVANPSDSGFLLQDRKITASDIISMIGTQPLPSLVFSNACKSGHTEAWKAKENYGTEIYGLANAFLLAGVRHYIGTIWNIKDEPGLYFALDFYKELMNGAMIGEAVRKARVSLMNRYGEDSVIWASYMLYGDPTFSYVNVFDDEDEGSAGQNRHGEERLAVAGTHMRSMENTVSFPPKKQSGLWIAAVCAIIAAVVAVYSFLTLKQEHFSPAVIKPAAVTEEERAAEEQRIDRLVEALLRNYERGSRDSTGEVSVWKTVLPTMVFLNVQADGMSEADRAFILWKVAGILQASNRVRIVEREVIRRLLEELKLSSSELADPATVLKIGRILSAKIIATGSMVKNGEDWQVSLRLIETETTSILAAISEIFTTGSTEDASELLSGKLLEGIKAAYPLKGQIISSVGGRLITDIGKKAGASKGIRMSVFADRDGIEKTVGEVKIASVEEETSEAEIISQSEELKKGFSLKEIL